MANYHIDNEMGGTPQVMSSTYKTLLAATAASGTALRRFKVYELVIGTNGTPANNEMEFDVMRQTAAGTITAITPNPLDPADAAALTVCGANATAEGTITAASQMFYAGLNQQATQRWVASPGSELVAPATNLAGFALRAKSAAYTGTATAMINFQEQ